MGHYDTNQTRKNMNRDGKKTGYFLTGIIGAMIGAITISLTTPYIDEIKGGAGQFTKNNEVNQVTPVSHKPDGMSSLQNMIEDAKEVVVGVINYQKIQIHLLCKHNQKKLVQDQASYIKKQVIRFSLSQIIM